MDFVIFISYILFYVIRKPSKLFHILNSIPQLFLALKRAQKYK